MQKPVTRTRLRQFCGIQYYRALRTLRWYTDGNRYASYKVKDPLSHKVFTHQSLLLRQLKDVDMWMQHNKVDNLRLAIKQINGIVIRPGETFSYWKLIGKPTRSKGYKEGMLLHHGQVKAGIGGGLCQLSNLIYWMALHTPLTVPERYRHGYDVFPDSGRTLPFGSGATCFYNYLDLQIRNDTQVSYQLILELNGTHLVGKWFADDQPLYSYEVYERSHWISQEFWGGYIRHNIIGRRTWNTNGELILDEELTRNDAIMMYEPCLPESKDS